MPWQPDEVVALRNRLGLNRSQFARLVGVELRTVVRWETGNVRLSGPPEAVLSAIRASLDEQVHTAEQVKALVGFLVGAAALGGLAFLIGKLLEDMARRRA